MAIRLGGEKHLTINKKDADGNPTDGVTIWYREPNTKERNQYIASGGSLKLDTQKGLQAMLDMQVEASCRVITKVEGVEPPEGMSDLEALKEYGGDYLRLFANYVYEGKASEEMEVDLGKSDETSG